MADIEYLVRGALLQCDQGTHPRRANLPKCHGVYVIDKPVMHKADCSFEENISSFGVCCSATPPDGAQEIRLAGYVAEGEEGKNVEDVQGLRCTPDIIGQWRKVKSETKITGSFSAITTESYLVCVCGGLIEPITSGQEYED